ncbi:beta-phosphoglucomutase [Neobacillus pocheonensis]|uniref:beta-phosphoglucomutase n=1 Tax=Neobacillus pocheonensis TaxID=363869 RepID=UPI003D271BF2
MKRKLEAVIFDLDGVIADTFELYYIANKKVAEQLSLSFSRKDNEKFKGIGRMEIIDAMVKQSGKFLSDEEKKELANNKNIHYQQLLQDLDEKFILPGMKQLIINLKDNNIRIGLASSSTNGETVLKQMGLLHYFDTIVDPSSLKKGKPDPEIFLKAADSFRIPYENCAAIEDGEAGLRAIKATKMFSVGVGMEKEMGQADWHVMSTEEITLNELLKRFKGDL